MLSDRLNRIVQAVFAGSVNAAAVAAGVNAVGLHRLVNDKVDEPRLGTVRQYSDAFGVPLAWLLGDQNAEGAQGDDPLPEPFWLIRAFHRKQQAPIREQLSALALSSTESRTLASEFGHFEFFPLSPSFVPGQVHQLAMRLDPSDRADVALMRQMAELETELLASALRIARNSEPRTKRKHDAKKKRA